MKIFTNTRFEGFYPGTAAVIVAKDKAEALALLKRELDKRGLGKQDWDDVCDSLQEVPMNKAQAIVLHDGDY